ncbi:MAG: ferritin-like domain-containing protein [Comamonadaceae bacterium]|nr:MAG: ferritin-like domain-containing protein [Comamonadaceae bacterium]
MQPTTSGMNKTGAAARPECAQAMAEAVQRFSPPSDIDTSAAERLRLVYLSESQALGSIPRPASFAGTVKTGVAQLMGERPELLMDKIGERIAFERGGVRLYDALLVKCRALGGDAAALAQGSGAAAALDGTDQISGLGMPGDDPIQALERIRAEELEHFHMLCDAMSQLGGDPTAQTPCADVVATASLGLIQVVTDPRTTLAQSFNAVLTAELTDNAGWELLIELADKAGESELSGRFATALEQEARHLLVVRNWLTGLLMSETTTPAI